ncbi:hypothetical protein SDRG_02508 [Saprolegnia diclina VS20]|uniref:Fe2OG dioxygenase domain-containing protein n=1 Tax=Saprolegnia diclina (strain VS20) TaxID=1156394 RepID=T0QP08_SAPDV|nr:hypothetical protein SDRG_02508 [Saprolegnia diclina VS20]EQC39849.1 hypothetical protein SDRG_02508 [Saprolegnia diclina VS20]|eukprot:XP_008606323.1 hypothetical protein SDRG_02508 [Saprolegnia diclina VS20]
MGPKATTTWLCIAAAMALLAYLVDPSATREWLLSSTLPHKPVTVYANGKSINGVAVALTPALVPSGDALAAYLSTLVEVEGLANHATPVVADRVYTGNGYLVTSYDDIAAEDRLYLVAPGLLFVWPFVKPGHRVYIESTQSPTDAPLILESWTESPRVFHVHHFFSEADADVLIQQVLAKDDADDVAEHEKLRPSTVGSSAEGVRRSTRRTSENAFDSTSPAAIAFRKRSFDLLRAGKYDPEMCDGVQILRYGPKQAYVPHTDYFSKAPNDAWNPNPHSGGTNRFATIFLYLSNVTRGGQTVFPNAEMPEGFAHPQAETHGIETLASSLFEAGSWEHDMTLKCHSQLASYPRKAHAILFYSQKPNGELDPASFHGGCPVLDGTKWGANLWVWNKKRHVAPRPRISVRFENPTDAPVDLYWRSKLMKTLGPRQHHVYNTHATHVWTIKDSVTGAVLLETVIDDAADQVVAL